ncbi:hypothetical protein Val02_50970 [Virgisporangium aliadipatigenens]|uniref:Serine aminopeptidase S33 domain-containing protein n=1 Tax=Virgisporangium aliadipatigenens TaxID=741659 RepID=A0A8J3YMX5_9ACTN|nr:alpha/beta fold hydrolase [Virgisporangium aliadipatigenens]GIJ48211.1 hypothetical protein Val02_50970 [Virgisporangium aliadipatigenens]
MTHSAATGQNRIRRTARRDATLVALLLILAGAFGLARAGDGLRSTSATVDGIPLEVVRAADTPGKKPAVVVAHGYAGSGQLMRPFADTLARRGYVVVLPDLAGHAGNTKRLSGVEAFDRDLIDVVRYTRGRADVDPDRVALLGHSLGASAVTRVGAADQGIAATVAISMGDDGAARQRPGPRKLLLLMGAFEPGLRGVAERADAGRVVPVPFTEHVSVLYADRTHHEAARWLDDALGHTAAKPVIEAKRRVAAGGTVLAGAVLLMLVGVSLLRPSARPADALLPRRLPWLLAAPLAGIVGGVLCSRLLPSGVTGYLIGYTAFAGLVLAAIRRPLLGGTASGAGLAVVSGAAVVLPVHAGLTSMTPHGAHVWLVALLFLAVAFLLSGVHAVVPPPWGGAVLAAVCLPLPVAAVVGLAPGFLLIVTPLIAILCAVHLASAAVAWRTGIGVRHTVLAGALAVAWPVAAALPLT